MTNTEAQALFHDFNQRYFDGKLPRYRVEVVEQLGVLVAGQIEKKQRCILLLASALEPLATLLHEMAHAATNKFHGTQWQAEMRRLAKAGAPVDPNDLTPDPPPYKRLLEYAMLFVADHPEGSLEQFEQYVLSVRKEAALLAELQRSPLHQWPRSLPRAFQKAKEHTRAFMEGRPSRTSSFDE
jgi:hypothetical protein